MSTVPVPRIPRLANAEEEEKKIGERNGGEYQEKYKTALTGLDKHRIPSEDGTNYKDQHSTQYSIALSSIS